MWFALIIICNIDMISYKKCANYVPKWKKRNIREVSLFIIPSSSARPALLPFYNYSTRPAHKKRASEQRESPQRGVL